MAKAPVLRKRQRKAAALAEGLRPLTAAEHRRLGIAPSKRLYTTQKSGVKRLDAAKTLSRRQAEQYGTLRPAERRRGQDFGSALRGKTFEQLAKERRVAGGGRTPMDRYNRAVRAYAQKNDMTIGEARSSPIFRSIYRDVKNQSRAHGATGRRLDALYDLDLISEDEYDYFIERWEAGSPPL